MKKLEKYVLILVVLAFLILFEQQVYHGVFFEVSDLHHETATLMLLSSAVAIYFTMKRKP